MSLKNYLTIVVICFTMSFFLNMNSVNALTVDCRGGYNTGFFQHIKWPSKQHKCDPKNCHHNNCVADDNSIPPSTQNCVIYQYYDKKNFVCLNSAGKQFKCPHQDSQAPFIR
ncbi:uncharacterized protein MELLADRAFT_123275 [Melampsora larici-populina 98AG31]|uniref:Secreted protein n=1 Tax=Melampsora larici-populina (strain 98AG31 / pathotype 3-4-7) TaxID=747676 RepID=F4R6R4_MELLP|nr:uncharacterized protein MELLADRAFT_123275 [Melampsora larici-populina 98AG31]EGG12413.1 secreted protein [Melampsora larici-populina 98AG31]